MPDSDARTGSSFTDRPTADPVTTGAVQTDAVGSDRTVRELIVELSRTEDALREWRSRRGQREVPVLDVHALLAQQRDLVAQLRRLSATTDLSVDLTAAHANQPADPSQTAAS
jgi:hypothetical protein